MQIKRQRVIIIGCGFSGLSAARRLCASMPQLDILLVDKKASFDFLPLLPDVIGRQLDGRFLSYDIESICRRLKCAFVLSEVLGLNTQSKQISLGEKVLPYDYLVIASGSQTNFYGSREVQAYAYALDCVNDARRISCAVEQNRHDYYFVCGGGYTGVEVASNLKLYFDKRKMRKKVVIVERSSSILGPLPAWMKEYVKKNLERQGIEILTDTLVDKLGERSVSLSGGKSFEPAMAIWVAGVKSAGYLQALDAPKNAQGRIESDSYLRLNASCFVAGDAGVFSAKAGPLRMAVQFAIAQGEHAAENLIRSIKGRPLIKFRPLDLGYIIPMANNNSCGRIIGLDARGYLPTLLHYAMCIYRSLGAGNKLGVFKGLLRGGGRW